jgi:Flp pilus assembly protein TadG
MVEAAITLPLFFAVLFSSLRILVICYQGVRLQYEVSETTRMTFTLDSEARGGQTWKNYFSTNLAARASGAGLSGLLATTTGGMVSLSPDNINVKHIVIINNTATSTSQWPGGSAKPGDTFSVEVTSEEPLLPEALEGIASPSVTLRAKAVAMIHRTEVE